MWFSLSLLMGCTGPFQQNIKRISFVMSDSTAHNLGVVEEVCEDLNIKEVSGSLLCNVHQLMMFDWKMKELCQKLHDCPSGEKLEDCFLVDIDFQRESFPIQAIKCLSFFFFCNDFFAKPRNYTWHFGEFIRTKENVTLSPKDSWFYHLPYCCIRLFYLFDDIASYLKKFSDLLNNAALNDPSFVKMKLLKPIFAEIAVLWLHITHSFHCLLMYKPKISFMALLNCTRIWQKQMQKNFWQ